jgi:hypothetical protein
MAPSGGRTWASARPAILDGLAGDVLLNKIRAR